MASVYSMPDKDIKRSSFNLNARNLMTMSAGSLYPIYIEEYMPGDTFSVDVSTLVRMSTPIHPVMDDCFIDIYFFSVPHRLTWEHWVNFIGERENDPYADGNPEYTVPQLVCRSDESRIPFKSLMDYFGLPAGEVVDSISALPFRAYGLIWNEWFRSEFLQNPIDVPTDDADRNYATTVYDYVDSHITEASLGGSLAPVNKFHDLFTSATVEPQLGNDIPLPLSGIAPVYTSGSLWLSNVDYDHTLNPSAARFVGANGVAQTAAVTNGSAYLQTNNSSGSAAYNSGMLADLGDAASVSEQLGLNYSTINDLRYAFAIQSLVEHDLYGTRYHELIKSHFGVDAPLGLLQKPEFLGHKRIPITMSQVLQTSATDSVSPQGNASGFSLTKDTGSYFTKSFVEHGYVIGLACIRTTKSYSQNVDKMWSRKDRYDFYWPELANIPNQPIKLKEIYCPYNFRDPGVPQPDSVFGYAEAWYDYRTKQNKFCGEFRSNYPQSLDSWHYGEDFTSPPTLSDLFIREDRTVIDRTLAVNSNVADQFICDFYFTNKAARPLPVYSVPGIRGFF